MINVDEFESSPMLGGQARNVVLSGDGPFHVTVSCFVDRPPPAGFRPCGACGAFTVQSGQPFQIHSDQALWRGKKGSIIVDIVDAVGATKRLKIAVRSDTPDTSGQTMASM
jgi:hypothetical protein